MVGGNNLTYEERLRTSVAPCGKCGGASALCSVNRLDNTVGYNVPNCMPSCLLDQYGQSVMSTEEDFNLTLCIADKQAREELVAQLPGTYEVYLL